MTSVDVLSYLYWQKIYEKNGFLIGRNKSLCESEVFLWIDESIWDINHSFWQWFSDAKELLGYMQFVFFPRHIGYIMDEETENLPELHELLELLETRKDEDLTDIYAIVKIINTLNSLHKSHSTIIMKKLKLLCRNFNKRQADPTCSSGLEIVVFAGIDEVCKEIIRRAKKGIYQEDYSPKWKGDWVATCDSALSNRRAMSKFLKALSDII